MIQTSFENKVQIQDILSNQVPEFIASENPKFTEFLKQYYISQEISGGNVDIVENLPFYLKLDNFTSKVVNGKTELTQNVGTAVENGITSEIFVADTEGFPKTYGLIQIDNEIITYKSKTATSFVDCVRNFSGVDEYGKNLKFSSTNISSHTSGTTVINLSVLFLKEFYSKIKSSLLPELDSVDLYDDLDVNNFLKNTTSLYRTKGSKESFRILFKSLFNIEPQIVDLEDFVIKSSNSDFRRRKELLVELISDGEPSNIVGQQFTKSNDPEVFGSVSETEILARDGRTFYKILLYLGFDEANDETTSVFTITPSTKLIDSVSASDNQDFLTVDSTIGFAESGSVFHDGKEIFYTEKTINQFLGCYTLNNNFIDFDLKKTDNIHSNDTYFSYENGDLSKKVEFRLLGSLSQIKLDTTSNKDHVNAVGEKVRATSFGKNIENTDSNTRLQTIANSLIYNTSVRIKLDSINFDDSIANVKTNIDDSFLKVGDKVEVLRRNTEIVETELSDLTIISINNVTGEITFDENFTSLNRFGEYDIRRKLKYGSSSEVQFEYDKFTSNVSNVYDEEGEFLYIASNSIPSYEITKDVIKSTVASIENYEILKEGFTTLRLNVQDNKIASSLIDGDRVYYSYSGDEPINGLKEGEYFITITNARDIKLYRSESSIFANDFIYFNQGSSSADQNSIPEGTHTFTLLHQITDTNKISTAKSLRKIPTKVDYSKYGEKTQAKPIGVLVNGVEIMGPISDNRIYYGPIDRVNVINQGSGYDVINPPNLKVETGSAKIQPVVQGTIEKVYIDNTNFEVIDPVVTITGGNGKNALLKASTRISSKDVFFNAKRLDDGGGISIVDETITFLTEHNFYNGQKVFYDQNDINNPKIGLSEWGGQNVKTSTLNNNTPFYVKVINTKTVELYPSLGDYRSGINTIGISTEGNYGVHKFKTEPKNVISSIVVENPGEGFTNRKLIVKQSGISTINNTINFDNHGFSSGELINYEYETSGISGLSTSNQYYVLKVDDNSFRVCDAGIGGTNTTLYNRQKYVSIASSGVGYQYFKYPDIEVSISYLADGEQTQSNITCTPVVKGSIIDAYLYEEGADYGSTILNVEEVPKVILQQGKEASFTPILSNGKIDRVVVNYGGYDYYSVPELEVVSSKGVGALLRAKVAGNRVVDVVVIESGLGYTTDDILIKPVFSGKDGFINPRIRPLSIDNSYKYGTQYLDGSRDPSYEFLLKNVNDELQYVVSGYSSLLKDEFNESDKSHSRIIGWAYDGNPIYGSFGYEDPEDPSSAIKRLVSGYTKSLSNVKNRPTNSEFVNGYFVEDYKFTNSGDLDIFNGRWCKTPEFPNGVYAYFATSVINSDNIYIGSFPYFVGINYRSKVLKENNDNNLNQSFNFENSSLLRNTYPYKVQDENSTYDFFPTNKSSNNQTVEITSVTTGSIDSYEIIKSGLNFKVGDSLNFKNAPNSSGFGLEVEVSEIYGKGISSIDNQYKKYSNSNLYRAGKHNSFIKILPSHNIKNNTKISVTGLTTDFELLNGEYTATVDNFKTRITEAIPEYDPNANSGTYHEDVAGIVTDIKVERIPPRVSIGSSILIKGASYNQHFTILNYFRDKNVLRCRKTGISGLSTAFSEVEYLPSIVSINYNIDANNIKDNYIRYFNPVESIGVGTYPGIGTSRSFHVGTETITKIIPTQSIRIPNHGFVTGEKVILRKPTDSSNSITAKDDPGNAVVQTFLSAATLSKELYVINKSKDYIGIVTSVGLTTTTNGLYFPTNSGNGSDNYEYELETVYEEQLCNVYQNLTTVSISTIHDLKNNDQIELTVIPSLNTGIGSTTFSDVKYLSEIGALSTKTIGFSTLTDINTSNNTITINNHLLNSGDRVYYISTSTPSGLSTDVYYINRVDVDTIRLSETYIDATSSNPKIVSFDSVGVGTQEISIIESDIVVHRNNNLVFDLSDSSLKGYELKLFYDEGFKNEFLTDSSTSSFSVVGLGTVGVTSTASMTLNYSDGLPDILYYSLTNSSSNSVNPTYKSKIIFKDSEYNGKYTIFDVSDQTFDIYLNEVPERLSYLPSDCSKIEYSTTSTSGIGSVSKLKIIDGGNNYSNTPYYSGSDSTLGEGLLVLAKSTSLGKIQSYSQLTDGYEYSADRTISPSINSSTNVILSDSNELTSVSVVDGGKGYPSPPNIAIVDTFTGKQIDRGLLVANMSGSDIGNSNIESVTIAAPVNGLPERQVTIKAVDNANGIRIDRVDSNIAGIMTCYLKTPIIGYSADPFEIGDKVFIEHVESLDEFGIGFNSKDHGFEFFDVIDYVSDSNPGEVVLRIPKLYGNPGVAVTFQVNTFATIVKSTNYPRFSAEQNYSSFFLNEEIVIIDDEDSTIETGLKVEQSTNNYIKLTGNYKLSRNQTIIGKSSGVRATIFDVSTIDGIYTVAGSFTKDYGWTTDSGKLSIDTQVIPDNDYYQNLSYTIKSEKTWDEIKTPVNSTIHPIGTKNFADTQIQRSVSGISSSGRARDSIVDNLQSFVSRSRVDAIKNYDMVLDFDPLENSSKFIQFQNIKLSDFFRSATNRVLQIDDISGLFSSRDDNDTEIFALLKDLTDKRYFYKFLIQIKSTEISRNKGDNHVQFSEIIALYNGSDKVYYAEKSAYTNNNLYNVPDTYGEISVFADDTGKFNVRFDPDNPYDIDYEFKVLSENYTSFEDVSSNQSFGSIDTFIDQVNIESSIKDYEVQTYDLTEYDSFLIEAHVLDKDSADNDSAYFEIISLHNGSEYTISEQNFDTSDTTISNVAIGTFGLKKSSDDLILTFYGDDFSNKCVKLKTYAFGDSSSGVGTYRFKSTRQDDGAERTVILDSSVSNTGTSSGIVTTRYYDRDLFSTVKSLVRVSVGNSISLHQIVSIHDDTDAFIVESPVVSIGDTMGVFNIGLDNNNMYLEFERNSKYSETDLTITQFDTIFYDFLDELNLPNNLEFLPYVQKQSVARYYGLNSQFRNKKNFVLKYNDIPIYAKSFDPYDTDVLPDPITGEFNIKDHYFSTGERLIYTPKSTFIGMGNSAMHVAGTNAGLSTEVYAIKINNDKFKLATTAENANAGTFISIDPNYLGEGNAHQFEMYKKNEKSLITINNLVQYPLLYTNVTHSISESSVGVAQSFFTLSGISSVNPEDIIKVDDEYMRVLNVGIGTSASGPILYFTGDLNIVEVERGSVGSAASTHDINAEVDVYTGSYNIVGDEIFFTKAPRGNIGDLAAFDESNLPRERATFSGRTFLRLDYTTNEIYDDFSHQFDGVRDSFELTTLGLSTVGLSTGDGNGLLFLNGMFQTPLTENISNHNFQISSDENAGITTVTFTGVTTSTGEKFISVPDINQNQLPRGGLIVSLGSTAGLGYAPLVGAKVRLDKDSNGSLVNPVVSIASTGKTVAITTASYDNVTGILDITSPQEEIYKLVQAKANLVKLVGLAFTCNSNPGVTVEFPSHNDTSDIIGIGTTTFSVNVGISTLEHYYVGFGTVYVWHDKLNNGSGYRPENLIVSVRDAAEDYEHKFVRATSSAVQSGGGYVHTFSSGVTDAITANDNTTYTAQSGTTYNADTGLMEITIGSHSLTTSNTVTIADDGIVFTCSGDSGATTHAYPRSTDPASGQSLAITAVTATTITVNVGASPLVDHNVTGATYNPTSGVLVLTIEDHGLITGKPVKINTESITFTCSSDGHKFEIDYPRSTDPLAGILTTITATTTNTITVDAGSMVGSGGVVDVTVGLGGTLSFAVSSPGSNYTDPKLDISNPSYENLSVEGITRGGQSTTDTGINMLVNVEIGPAPGIDDDGNVGIGSTLFEVSSFNISRAGYAFQRGDVMRVVGLVTDARLSEPIEEFKLFVLDTYNDSVAAWQLGEMNIIDSIKPYQNGRRKVFPLYYNSELLSFSKDLTNADSLRIDFSSLLVIFINGVLQEPGESYEFGGGSSFRFLTPPKEEDDVKIYFYVGTRGVDSIRIDVDETIQVGDILEIQSSNEDLENTTKQDPRIVFDIPNADTVETGLYLKDGINSEIEKPVDWIKQKEDIIVNQQIYYKSRDSLEPQIYPTAKVISGFSTTDTEIYLDNADLFNYEETVDLNNIDILLQDYQQDVRVGIITAIVSGLGTISSFDIVNAGVGYTGTSASIKVSNPIIGIGTNRKWYSVGIGSDDSYPATVTGSVGIETNHIIVSDITNIQVGQVVSSIDNFILNGEPTVIFVSNVGIVTISNNTINTYPRESTFNFGNLSIGDVGIGTTATASVTIANGSITGVTVVNAGSGYTTTNPPQVVVEFPKANNELLKRANTVKHLNGSVIGIGTTPGLNGAELAFEFKLTAPGDDFTDLTVGDPIYIFDTRIGSGITAIDINDNDTVGLGTQFLNSIYKIQSLDTNLGKIKCNILSTTDISGEVGVGTTGTALSPVGNYSWGKISGFIRSSDPVSIAVSSYTSSGLTTYPTVQRRGGSSGLRKTGALKKRTTST